MRYVPLFDLSPGGVEYGVPGTPFPSRHTPQLGGSHVSWGEIDHNVNEKESPGKLAIVSCTEAAGCNRYNNLSEEASLRWKVHLIELEPSQTGM